MEEIIVPKEKAVFWMDGDGGWHNRHGRFEHSKIIKHFHSCIQKDENGYHLCQERDGIREKVYFSYEETALFVFQVLPANPMQLLLNTGRSIVLDPDQLYSANDQLYIEEQDHCIKFSQKALMDFSSLIHEEEGHLVLVLDGKKTVIPDRS